MCVYVYIYMVSNYDCLVFSGQQFLSCLESTPLLLFPSNRQTGKAGGRGKETVPGMKSLLLQSLALSLPLHFTLVSS